MRTFFTFFYFFSYSFYVGMKPLSERDENKPVENAMDKLNNTSRNEATL